MASSAEVPRTQSGIDIAQLPIIGGFIQDYREELKARAARREEEIQEGKMIREAAIDRFFASDGHLDTSFPRASLAFSTQSHGNITINVSSQHPQLGAVYVFFDRFIAFRRRRVSLSLTSGGHPTAVRQDLDHNGNTISVKLSHKDRIKIAEAIRIQPAVQTAQSQILTPIDS